MFVVKQSGNDLLDVRVTDRNGQEHLFRGDYEGIMSDVQNRLLGFGLTSDDLDTLEIMIRDRALPGLDFDREERAMMLAALDI